MYLSSFIHLYTITSSKIKKHSQILARSKSVLNYYFFKMPKGLYKVQTFRTTASSVENTTAILDRMNEGNYYV